VAVPRRKVPELLTMSGSPNNSSILNTHGVEENIILDKSNHFDGIVPSLYDSLSKRRFLLTVLLLLVTRDQGKTTLRQILSNTDPTDISQPYISSEKLRLLARPSRIPSWDPWCESHTLNLTHIWLNGLVVCSAACPCFTSEQAVRLITAASLTPLSFRFVVLASDRDTAHKVFSSPGYAKPCIVLIAADITGSTVWTFLQGRVHTEYRRVLADLFTNKALSTYLPAQEDQLSTFMPHVVGAYISQGAVRNIANEFHIVSAALELVNIPPSRYIPFSKS
jgi:hypothetical protein